MSNMANERIIEEALEVAAELDGIDLAGRLKTVSMYVQDNDIEAVHSYLHDMKTSLRAYNEVAHEYAQEIY